MRVSHTPGVARWLVLTLSTAGLALAGCGSESSTSTPSSSATHAVIVHLVDTDFDEMVAIEDGLEPAISDAAVGEYDGNEIAVDGSEATLFAYGPDADALWGVMRPIVEQASPPPGSYAIKQYGDPEDFDTLEVRVELG